MSRVLEEGDHGTGMDREDEAPDLLEDASVALLVLVSLLAAGWPPWGEQGLGHPEALCQGV